MIESGNRPIPPARIKPRLRGVSHQIAFFLSLMAGALLVATTHGARTRIACAVYAASLAALFGISALYHRPMWPADIRARLRRADHSAIYLFIAGTYTPICLLAMGPKPSFILLTILWTAALLGIAKELLWTHPPRWITTLLFLAMGWAGVSASPAVYRSMGLSGIILFLGGGVLYSSGAIIYARKRPDPLPTIFGYHEIFHLLVIAAAALHFTAISQFVWGNPMGEIIGR